MKYISAEGQRPAPGTSSHQGLRGGGGGGGVGWE